LDIAARTVSCRVPEEPTIWLPSATAGVTVAQAWDVLAGLQELLSVLDGGEVE
jgi:hypothetical protein